MAYVVGPYLPMRDHLCLFSRSAPFMHHPTLHPSTRGIGLSLMCLAALLLALAFTAASPAHAAATTYYVRASATGANTGASWSNAYISLQDALTASISGDQIWVAAGT